MGPTAALSKTHQLPVPCLAFSLQHHIHIVTMPAPLLSHTPPAPQQGHMPTPTHTAHHHISATVDMLAYHSISTYIQHALAGAIPFKTRWDGRGNYRVYGGWRDCFWSFNCRLSQRKYSRVRQLHVHKVTTWQTRKTNIVFMVSQNNWSFPVSLRLW